LTPAPRHVASSPAADAAEHEEAQRGGDLSELTVPPATAFGEQVGDPEARRYRLTGSCNKEGAKRLPLLGILREPRLLLGMRRKIGVDGLGALGRQSAIDPGL